ncbi:4'-phosphopantetheinyl transferase family protein [Azospirillum sp. ST 5-10]|uniref:4'-phosphopantetheinyl transferase family protein n=1 Tax=unclassified Azospirillum TaxID=2630922 RepID=UPI003F49C503
MTQPPALPACCTPCADGWPFAVALPGGHFAALAFDAGLYEADAFRRCGWEMPAPVVRAVAKRQAAFLAGRLCADRALRGLTGRGGCPPIGADRAPVWPPGCCGSISHGRDRAVAVVGSLGRWAGLGVDVEDRVADADARPLQDAIAGPAEIARLEAVTGSAGAAVTLALSLKESLFKALFPLCRRMFYCDAAEIEACTATGTARLRLCRPLSPDWPAGRCVEAHFAVGPDRVHSLVAVPAMEPRP